MDNKTNDIKKLIKQLDLEETTELLDIILIRIVELRENIETPHLTAVGEAKTKAEVVPIDVYRKPPPPINLDDYRNRSHD